MGMTVASKEQYEASVRKLFPQGEYWDRQFTNPESDVSLFVKAKAQELHRFRIRMSALLDEGRIDTAVETLPDWERVLLGTINYKLDAAQRRGILLALHEENFTIETVNQTGRLFGITVTNICFPFRPAFFAHARFGVDRIASSAAFSVLFVYASAAEQSVRSEFEKRIVSIMPANYSVYFIYGGE